MTPLRKQTEDYIIIRGFSKSTRKSYLSHLRRYAIYFNSCPSLLEESHIIEYLRYLSEDKEVSVATINCAYSALKLLYANVLQRTWNEVQIPRPKRKKRLPVILSQEQVQQIFSVTTNIKHRTLLMLTYSAGLRLSEATRVKVKHLVKSRKRVFVHQGKGGKDRYSILSNQMLEQLEVYQKLYRPHHWLFNGKDIRHPISNRTLQAIYYQAKHKAKILEEGGVHQLRHCFATHMLEAGMNIFDLKKLMGHASIKTTSIYLQTVSTDFSDFEHPMDMFANPQKSTDLSNENAR